MADNNSGRLVHNRSNNWAAAAAGLFVALTIASASASASPRVAERSSNIDTSASLGAAMPATASRRQLFIENDSSTRPTVAAAAIATPSSSTFQAITSAASAGGRSLGAALSGLADSLLGIRYRFGGNTEEGLDCSGLVRLVWQRLGLGTLPRTAASMAAAGLPIAKSELAPGDLVFFNTLGRSFSHVGVYLGEGRFLHASTSKRQVVESSLNERYFVERFDGARRVTR